MKRGNFPATASRLRLLSVVSVKLFLTFLILGLLLFVPAGSFEFWNGWLYLASLLVPMIVAVIYLLLYNPELLEKRMKMKEREQEQQRFLKMSLFFFLMAFMLPGLDFRYGWSSVPRWMIILATMIMMLGYTMFIVVMRQNQYASRVIEIQADQKVIDHGLYSIVRHPMYLSAIIIYLASPIILGSYYSLIPMALLPFILAYRIKNEEQVLLKGLSGYKEYTDKVKYRLIPFIW